MRKYTIIKKPDILDWSNVPKLSIDYLLWSDPVDIKAEAALCYDDDGLYVYLTAVEENIRAENSGKLGIPCEDSCLEFFFSPVPGDKRYINIELNPNGCLYLGFGSGRHDHVRLITRTDPICAQPERTADGWQVTYTVPWTLVKLFFPNFKAESGGTMRANCYKCGDLTVQPHYLASTPIPLENPEFHCPEHFGLMQFE